MNADQRGFESWFISVHRRLKIVFPDFSSARWWPVAETT
jgi:hypothetical protein